jgi:phosphoribosylcarboxyaminoimidazole (NCAIR) mutase
MMGLKYPELRQAMKDYKKKMEEDIVKLDEEFQAE